MEIELFSKKHGKASVIIDDEDYDLIKGYTWTLIKDHGKYYASTSFYVNEKLRAVRMHRLLLNMVHSKDQVDHIDNNGLNNRRSNIRTATIAENSRNVGPTKRSSTGFKGVFIYEKGRFLKKYVVRIKFNGKNILGGYFEDVIEAAKKYNELAMKYHGDFAFLNKV